MAEKTPNEKIDEIHKELFHPSSKKRQFRNLIMGVMIGIFISLAIEGFVQSAYLGKEIQSLREPEIVNILGNITNNELNPFEWYLFEARVKQLIDTKFFFQIAMFFGFFGLAITIVIYQYINKFDNVLYLRISYKAKKRTFELVEILKEIKSVIFNDKMFYRHKKIKVEDEYDNRIKKGRIYFKRKYIGKIHFYVDVEEEVISIICPNNKAGEDFRDSLFNILINYKKYKNIKSLKELAKGGYFSLR